MQRPPWHRYGIKVHPPPFFPFPSRTQLSTSPIALSIDSRQIVRLHHALPWAQVVANLEDEEVTSVYRSLQRQLKEKQPGQEYLSARNKIADANYHQPPDIDVQRKAITIQGRPAKFTKDLPRVRQTLHDRSSTNLATTDYNCTYRCAQFHDSFQLDLQERASVKTSYKNETTSQIWVKSVDESVTLAKQLARKQRELEASRSKKCAPLACTAPVAPHRSMTLSPCSYFLPQEESLSRSCRLIAGGSKTGKTEGRGLVHRAH